MYFKQDQLHFFICSPKRTYKGCIFVLITDKTADIINSGVGE